ncbi:MAG: MFS transporter [Janthinobacterium lividum]
MMSTQAASTPAETADGLPLPSPVQPDPLSLGDVIRIAPMRRMWYAQIVSVFGDFLALFAVISVMTFKLAATPQQITGVQIAYLLPIAVLGIISGVFVDRWPLKPTMVASDLIRAALCLLLLLVHSVWGFYGVLAAISIVSSFFSPAQGVAIRSLVPFHGLRSANALLQQAFFIMRIVGPSAAAFLVASLGAKSCYLIDCVSFVLSASFISSIALKVSAKTPAAGTQTGTEAASETKGIARIWTDMQAGTSFIVHHAALLFVIVALAAGMFVMGCFGPLVAIYVRDNLHASTRTFGIVSAMIGLGLLVGVNGLNIFAKRTKESVLVYLGLGGIASGTLLMALFPHLAFALLGSFLVGFSAAGIIVPSQTLIQQETPPELMGRVGSTVMSAIFTAQIGGLLLSGILAEVTSVRRVFALCTAILVILMIAGKVWMEPKPRDPVSSVTV